jgi:hypothetical protein
VFKSSVVDVLQNRTGNESHRNTYSRGSKRNSPNTEKQVSTQMNRANHLKVSGEIGGPALGPQAKLSANQITIKQWPIRAVLTYNCYAKK